MKNSAIILSMAACLGLAACNGNTNATVAADAQPATATTQGAIVYFDLDRVINEYDMANDLSSVVEAKVNSINQEVNRRGAKLEKDVLAFQDKINKGLLTQSVAEAQNQKLIEQQNSFQQYAAQKQQEIAEEQQVMLNNVANAIKTYLDEFNAEKKYALILTTQGGILPAPVAAGDPSLNITDELIDGLNKAYIKEKGKSSEK